MGNIKKNFIYQSAYQILAIFLPIITSPYVSRILGADGIGIHSYTYAIVSYFVLFAKLGIHIYGNRAIAIVRDDKEKLSQTFSDLYAVHFIVSAIVIIFYIMYILIFCSSDRTIFAIQGLFIVGQLFDINWFFFGIEKFKLTVTRNIIIKILTVICIFTFIQTKDDLWKYVAIMSFGSALSESIVWFSLKRYIVFKKPLAHNMKKHIRPMISFFIPSIAVSLYKVMDKIMLGYMSTMQEVGYYESSEKIVSASLGLVIALGTVMMPRMSNLIANGKEEESKRLINQSFDFIVALIMAISCGIIGTSRIFPTIFWGEEFIACSPLLSGLAFSMPFIAIANVLRTQYLIPRHKDLIYQASVFTGAAANLIVNYIMIRHYKALGAVFGTIVAEATVWFIQAYAIRKEFPFSQYIKMFLKYSVAGFPMCLICLAIGERLGVTVHTLVIQIFAGGIIYGILFLIICLATKNRTYLGFLKRLFSFSKYREK